MKSDKPDKFPGLTVKYVRGADPVIKLMAEDGSVQQTLGIEKWDTDAYKKLDGKRGLPWEICLVMAKASNAIFVCGKHNFHSISMKFSLFIKMDSYR